MEYKIMADMPPPAAFKTPSKYPFGSMAVGESFIIPIGNEYKVTQAAYRWRERHLPWNFRVGEDKDGCTRLWRVEDAQKRIKKSSNARVTY